ncbi:MAG: hypothetical protein ACOZFS_04670 [Thermodesulfobacteriota bacterium]
MPTVETGLLRHLKSERSQKKAKLPFKPSLFVKILALVQEYGLEGEFLSQLEKSTNQQWQAEPEYDRIEDKKKLGAPLFALATPAEFALTLAIIDKVNNPYLAFANSPDEILACNSLFRCDPALAPQKLAAHHFQTLLLCHYAEEELQVLTPRNSKPDAELDESLQKRLEKLRNFLAEVKA